MHRVEFASLSSLASEPIDFPIPFDGSQTQAKRRIDPSAPRMGCWGPRRISLLGLRKRGKGDHAMRPSRIRRSIRSMRCPIHRMGGEAIELPSAL